MASAETPRRLNPEHPPSLSAFTPRMSRPREPESSATPSLSSSSRSLVPTSVARPPCYLGLTQGFRAYRVKSANRRSTCFMHSSGLGLQGFFLFWGLELQHCKDSIEFRRSPRSWWLRYRGRQDLFCCIRSTARLMLHAFPWSSCVAGLP